MGSSSCVYILPKGTLNLPQRQSGSLGTQAVKPGYGSHRDVLKAIEKLREAFPEEGRVVTDPIITAQYGSSDNTYLPTSPHSVVVCIVSLPRPPPL